MTNKREFSNNQQLKNKRYRELLVKEAEKLGRATYTIVLNNTVGLSSDMIRDFAKAPNNNIKIRVRGGVDETKKTKYNRQDYIDRTTYSPVALSQAVAEMEKLERQINPQWSDLSKALFVYRKLAKGIRYDDAEGPNCRKLTGIVGRKLVCAGYALLYKEMMDRSGVPCEYINIKGSHCWNTIKINNTNYPVDLTWDSSGYHSSGTEQLQYFGRDRNFNRVRNHIAGHSEPIIRNNLFTDNELKQALSEINTNPPAPCAAHDLSGGGKLNVAAIGPKDGKTLYAYCKSDGDKIGVPTIVSGSNNVKLNDASQLNSMLKQSTKVDTATAFEREDGSSFLLVPSVKKRFPNVNQFNYLEFYKNSNGDLRMRKGVLFSEQDLLHPKGQKEKYDIANTLLSQERVKNKLENVGGYVGYVINGQKFYNRVYEKTIGNYRR